MRVVVDEREEEFRRDAILERLVNPERQIKFRVTWIDDKGNARINTGYRVQFNSAIGPYKGGLRLHPSVNLGIIKFLALSKYSKIPLPDFQSAGVKAVQISTPRANLNGRLWHFARAL